MMHFNFSAENRLLSQRVDTPRDNVESEENIDAYMNELRELTSQLRRVYGDQSVGDEGREAARAAVREGEESVDAIRTNLFEDLRKSGLIPGLSRYLRLGGDYPSVEGGLGWQPESGRLTFDASAYPDFTGGDFADGRSYSLDDPGADRTFSALLGTPGEVSLVSLFGPHADELLPYTENEEPFYVAPTGLYPSPLAMLSPEYSSERSRVREDTETGLDALRRRVRPYGTPGVDGFPPAPPRDEEETSTTRTPRRTGTPGRDGFPAAPPAREETATRRTPRTRPAEPARPETSAVARLEDEMAKTRRDMDAARREVAETRRLPPSTDRTARLTRLAERMENMVGRIETLEQEIRKLRGAIS